MKINFLIDQNHLAYKLWLSSVIDKKKPEKDWQKLKEKIESQFGDYAAYCFFDKKYMAQGLDWSGYQSGKDNDLIRDEVFIGKIFDEIFRSKVFQKAKKETEVYLKKVKQQWEDSKKWLKVFEKYIGLKLSKNVDIFILHPQLKIGSFIKDGKIEWGNPDNFPNYQFIGICHEILHLLTEDEFNKNKTQEDQWLLHAVIYLAADQELRVRINSSTYFLPELNKYYHPKLISKATEILPLWKEFLKNRTQKSIVAFFRSMKPNY